MPCYTPIVAWYGERTENNKRKLVFDRTKATGKGIEIPCGKCIGCKIEKSRQWAVRMMHETKFHDYNSFITLTYDDAHLPEGGGLQPDDLTKFLKRLRQFYNRSARKHVKIKYYACGEYGDRLGRPHYHCVLFGVDFHHDRKTHKVAESQEGFTQWESPSLDKLWGKGMAAIGSVTFESAAYVARYVTKKITGDKAQDHYKGKEPEFSRMSRNPAIGKEWILKYKDDVEKNHDLTIRGKKVVAPRYYLNIIKKENEEKFDKVKEKLSKKVKYQYPSWLRLAGYPINKEDWEDERAKVKKICKEEQLKTLKRRLETPENNI